MKYKHSIISYYIKCRFTTWRTFLQVPFSALYYKCLLVLWKSNQNCRRTQRARNRTVAEHNVLEPELSQNTTYSNQNCRRDTSARTRTRTTLSLSKKLSQMKQCSNQELINVFFESEADQSLFWMLEQQRTYETNLVSVILFMQCMTKNNFQNYGSRSM